MTAALRVTLLVVALLHAVQASQPDLHRIVMFGTLPDLDAAVQQLKKDNSMNLANELTQCLSDFSYCTGAGGVYSSASCARVGQSIQDCLNLLDTAALMNRADFVTYGLPCHPV